mmetsp:Transcript_20386/g.50899  ORF Transcript_20386/g.50899 Transcript_20386/m.50899 type:complete len:210 (+) Transcript_20386:712-1341(+)
MMSRCMCLLKGPTRKALKKARRWWSRYSTLTVTERCNRRRSRCASLRSSTERSRRRKQVSILRLGEMRLRKGLYSTQLEPGRTLRAARAHLLWTTSMLASWRNLEVESPLHRPPWMLLHSHRKHRGLGRRLTAVLVVPIRQPSRLQLLQGLAHPLRGLLLLALCLHALLQGRMGCLRSLLACQCGHLDRQAGKVCLLASQLPRATRPWE